MYDYKKETKKSLKEKANKNKNVTRFANARILLIDIDSEEDFRRWKMEIEQFEPILNFPKYKVEVSKGGLPHRHITVYLKTPLDIWKRIALQFCLGSDLKRETMNCYRQLVGRAANIVFFEKKDE
ncbi:hypothetical protein A2Z67_00945 [Candidatus Woesebacteria bacterium RBG_13_36_22]|uniref:Uncharacterized protein n=1 Tax=Candidatus Woesebacteria bacterium RBG_13_36_22 TaxID=1802478 RepID=A0A1F7WZF8_9BACT|nr:MAG: hypothetical protein A2Z67_00945 [Candidatus Woesebacteria bacterium RBG_13_36_22]